MRQDPPGRNGRAPHHSRPALAWPLLACLAATALATPLPARAQAYATPTPMAAPRLPMPVAPTLRPLVNYKPHAPRLQAPMLDPLATPRPKATARPRPKPTRKPAWRPPRGTIYVDGSGVYPASIRFRYGFPLHFMQPKGVREGFAIVAVDPHETRSGRLRPLQGFPNSLAADSKWTWLGDNQGLAHRHWPIAQGLAFTLRPDAFLALHDEINGAGVGYLWPVRYLFYVASGDRWRKLIVTVDHP